MPRDRDLKLQWRRISDREARPWTFPAGESWVLPQGMGNTESTDRYHSCVCFLQQVLRAGGVKVSEGRLFELLKAIEDYCSWFPTIGTLDLQTGEEVGHELKQQHARGKSIPITLWPTWSLIRSSLQPLRTPDSESDSK